MELSTIKQQINQLLDQYEKEHKEIGVITSTLLVNFGGSGRVKEGLVNINQRPFEMLLTVLEYYIGHKHDKDFQDWKEENVASVILHKGTENDNVIYESFDDESLYEYYLKKIKK